MTVKFSDALICSKGALEIADEADTCERHIKDHTLGEEKNNLVTKAWFAPILFHSLLLPSLDREAFHVEDVAFPKLILTGHQVEPNSHKKRAPSSA